jgi:hypothetical protein
VVHELSYGSDGQNLYLRIDFEPGAETNLTGADVHFTIQPANDASRTSFIALRFGSGSVEAKELRLADPERAESAVEFAFRKVIEVRMALRPLGVAPEHSLRLQISLWKDGLPVDALPQEGWIEVSTAEPTEWPL